MKILCHATCPLCKGPSILDVDDELGKRVVAWNDDPSPHKPFIQDALPELTPGQREQLITGMHDDCWNKMFEGSDTAEMSEDD